MRDWSWHSDYFGYQKACLGPVEMRCFCQPWEKINNREYALSNFSALLKFYLVFPLCLSLALLPSLSKILTLVLLFCFSQPWESGALFVCCCGFVCLEGKPPPQADCLLATSK